MLALTAHWCELADVFYGEQKTGGCSLIAKAEAKRVKNQASIAAADKMGLKFNFRRIPLQWRLLIGVQLGLSGAILMYRQRVLAVKAKQQE